MNVDQREALKTFLMIGAPIMLIIGALIPSFLIIPIAVTLYCGTFMGAYLVGDIEVEQEKYKPKVIISCSITIISVWAGMIYYLINE